MPLFKLITPERFVKLISEETKRRVIAVDSTWYLPNLKKDGKQEFLNEDRIRGAVYFDIDGIKDVSSEYPHMLPDNKTFNKGMSELGLKKDDILVAYDRIGNFSAPRCAWTLSVLGHERVYLLNNFPLYKKAGYPLDSEQVNSVTPYAKSDYVSDKNFVDEEVIAFDQMKELVSTGNIKNYNLFDARALARFTGEAPEPRAGLSSGHIPGAQPMPFTELLSGDKTYPTESSDMQKKLQAYVEKNNINLDNQKPTIAMCGTGVSGVIIKTALEHAGLSNVKLYDGSWTEWVLRNGEIVRGR